MSSYIDLKFISSISSRLQQFKRKNDNLFTFRCPHCGDSKKSKLKTRGYFYRVKNDMFFKCHNCGMGQNLANFIKTIDPKLHDEYILERYKGSTSASKAPEFEFKPVVFKETNKIEELKSIEEIPEKHPARKYVVSRKIPEQYFDTLLFCDRFMTLVNEIKPNTFKDTTRDHPRLIIPFYDTTGNLFAFQGRAFGNEQPKYLTIKLDETKQKIFGLDRVSFQKHIYITEGPIDSLFIDNAVAAAGADLIITGVEPNNITYIFDNEPRNKEIVTRMYKVIDKGYNLFIWPKDIKSKDINDLIISGKTIPEVQTIISNNTHNRLSALSELNTWKKCNI